MLATKLNLIFVVFPLYVWLWGYRRAITGMIFSMLIFVILLLPYLVTEFEETFIAIAFYNGWGSHGFANLLPKPLPSLIMISALALAPIAWKQRRLTTFLLDYLLLWAVVSTAFAGQYWTLILLFAAMDTRNERWLWATGVVVVIIYVALLAPGNYWFGIFSMLGYTAAWALPAFWLISRTFKRL